MLEYMYLWICILLFIPWGIIYYFRPLLRNRLVKSGLIALPFAFIDDIWFRVDYWNAPEIFSIYPIAIEDLLFCFVISGISITVFDALFTKEQIPTYKPRTKLTLSFFPITITSFIILHNILGINSMYMWAIPCFVLSVVVLLIRRDLILPSLISATIVTLIIIPIYMILFNIFAPDFWDTYWFLKDTKHGITILGNVALLELLYYFSFASIASIMYDFAKGTTKVYKKLF